MISNLFKSLRLTIAFCLFFSVFYIFVLWLFAQVAGPNKGNAELVTLNGKVVGEFYTRYLFLGPSFPCW